MSTVIVVGSGPSGLAAGFELQQAGHRVRMLEAADRVGGKMRSTARDGFVLDQGAIFLPTTHRKLLAIADRYGFAHELGPGGFVLATSRGGSVHELDGDHLARDFLRTPLLSKRAKLAAVKLAPELRRAKKATFDRMPEAGAFDTETVAEWAGRTLHPELAEYLICTTMRAMFNVVPENLSRVDFLAIVSLFAGAELVAFEGGMSRFADRVTERFDVQTRASVVGVEENGDEVRVTWRGSDGAERTESADGCVLAVPAEVALQVHPGIDTWRREFMGRVQNGHCMIFNVALSRPPKDLRSVYVQVPQSAHPFLAGIGVDHNKASGRTPPGKGLLSLAMVADWCAEHVDDPDEVIEKEILGALDEVLPDVSSTAEFTVVNRWRQEFNPVGQYRELGKFRALCASADRRIQLAGDYHSSQSLNSAAVAGERAAARLLPQLG